jgi:hypothetical protein
LLLERLPKEKEREVIERIARRIVSYGLEVPAILFLELHKPLANLVGHSLLFAFPFLAPFFGVSALKEATTVLSTEEGIEALIKRIEEIVAEEKSKQHDMERNASNEGGVFEHTTGE